MYNIHTRTRREPGGLDIPFNVAGVHLPGRAIESQGCTAYIEYLERHRVGKAGALKPQIKPTTTRKQRKAGQAVGL